MDTLYYDGREDVDSPILSPLTPNFDRYMSRGDDSSSYFGDAGAYGSLAGGGGDTYSMGSRGSVSDRAAPESGFPLDFLPTGDTLPRAYPGGTVDPAMTSPNTTTWDFDGGGGGSSSHAALYGERDSSEEFGMKPYGGAGGYDGYSNGGGYDFLPSPPEGDGGSGGGYGAPLATSGRSTRSGSNKKNSGGGGSGSGSPGSSDKKKRKHPSSSGKDGRDDKGGSSHRPTTQLRTASRAPKRYSQTTARRPAESAEEVKARAAHNQVEQQYRKRLNQQFERLLAVLPQPDYEDDEMAGSSDYYGDGGDGDGGGGGGPRGGGGGGGGGRGARGEVGGGGGMDKRISKAEVLDLARRRIKVLEKERATLERQKRELSASVVRMQEEWSRRLGGVPVKTEGKRG